MAESVTATDVLGGHPDVTAAEIVQISIAGKELTVGLAEVRRYVSGSSLREFVWQELGDERAPAGVLVFDHIPRAGGEIDLGTVATAAQDEGDSLFFHPPADQLETDVAAAWASSLGVPRVSVHDDFFDIGGESSVAVQIAVELERKSGTVIDVDELLDAGTVRKLAQQLRSRSA